MARVTDSKNVVLHYKHPEKQVGSCALGVTYILHVHCMCNCIHVYVHVCAP